MAYYVITIIMITVDITTVIATHINFFPGITVEYDCVVVRAFVSPHFFTLIFTNIDTSIGLTMNDLPSIKLIIDCIMHAVQKLNFGTKIMTLRTVKEASAVDFAEACKKLLFSSYR